MALIIEWWPSYSQRFLGIETCVPVLLLDCVATFTKFPLGAPVEVADGAYGNILNGGYEISSYGAYGDILGGGYGYIADGALCGYRSC